MKISAFGIAKDIFGSSMVEVDSGGALTGKELRILLEEKYHRLTQLGSYMIAVNDEYASIDEIINEQDEVAIIPPVSGG